MSPGRKALLLSGAWSGLLLLTGSLVSVFLPQIPFGSLLWIPFLLIFWQTGRRAAAEWRNSRRMDLSYEKRTSDLRPPVVYLRSFSDDGSVPEKSGLLLFFEWMNPNNLLAGALRPERTYEQVLTSSLRSVGPVVALAKPGEELPELGAARLQVQGCRVAIQSRGTSAYLRVGRHKLWPILLLFGRVAVGAQQNCRGRATPEATAPGESGKESVPLLQRQCSESGQDDVGVLATQGNNILDSPGGGVP
jgi:hypothetical protein